MAFELPQNLSYLLHLWQVERNGEPVWWASLENPRTGERQIFADLAELYVFLDEKTVNRYQPILGDALPQQGETTSSPAQPVRGAHPGYLSYLLRLLWADREGNPNWQISLQSIQTTERLNFKDLAALTAYLEKKLCESGE
jgi:hypothetical protein